MNFLLQTTSLFYLLCIFIAQTISAPTNNILSTKSYNRSEENGTINQHRSFPPEASTLSTTREYLSTSNGDPTRSSYKLSLKIIAILIACIVFVFAVGRLCLLVYNSSRPSNNLISTRRTTVVQPEIATIERNRFKPDLPPDYTEAVQTIDSDEGKLPSYEELRNTNTKQM